MTDKPKLLTDAELLDARVKAEWIVENKKEVSAGTYGAAIITNMFLEHIRAMQTVHAVIISYDYEGAELDSIHQTAELANARVNILKKEKRGDDVYWVAFTLNEIGE